MAGAADLTRNDYRENIAASNRSDFACLSRLYRPDVTLVIGGNQELRGRDAIVEFYRGVKSTTRSTISVKRFISTAGAIAAELESEFLALEDLPDFTAGPLCKGDRLFLNTIAPYDLQEGQFRRIRSAPLRKLHRAVPGCSVLASAHG